MSDDIDYAELFSALCNEYSALTGVNLPEPGGRGFGSNALKINSRSFAMLTGGRLVVKLPRARVTELIETGHGEPFDSQEPARDLHARED